MRKDRKEQQRKTTGRRLLQYAAREQRTIWLALLLLTAAVATELAGPFIAKTLIDRHILGVQQTWYETTPDSGGIPYGQTWYKRGDRFVQDEPRGAPAELMQQGTTFVLVPDQGAPAELSREQLYVFYRPEIPKVIELLGAYFLLLAVSSVFTYGQKLLLQKSANRIIQRLRSDVFSQLQKLPVSYYDNLPAGKVVSRVTNDTESIRELYVNVLSNFVTTLIYMIGVYTALFLLDVRLALLGLALVPVLLVWIWVYRKFATRYNTQIRSLLSDLNGMLNESIQGMALIRAFRRQPETTRQFEQTNEEHYTYQNRLLSLNSITSFNLVNLIRNVLFVTLVAVFGFSWLGGAAIFTVGVLYAFIDYMNRMFQPITGMVNQLANLDTALVSAERVFELIDERGTDVDDDSVPRFRGDIAFHQVSFSYKEGEPVLKNLSFEAKRGQTVALVGHTGSGKSSILNLLFRFYDPQQGTITIDGRSIADIPPQRLRRHMGIVLQDPYLFTGTIATNVSLGSPHISREQIEASLQSVGAFDVLGSLPGGIDEPVVEKGSTLSAGQRQLISFARALAYDPAIMILDEATSSIDSETEAIIQRALDVVKKGRTTFIIAHRLSTIRQADQILVLHRGEIVERGTHEELMRREGKYSGMVRLQQGIASEAALHR